MMPETTRRVFRFGPFEADEATGELRKHGLRVKLHAQPFQVLVMLLERPSELVTRDEMRQRLWGQDTFVDFDHGLNSAVNKMREALSDSASQPRYVETIAGKGYRFITPVTAEVPNPAIVDEKLTVVADATAGGMLAAVPPSENRTSTLSSPRDHRQSRSILAAPHELPGAPLLLVRILLLLTQAMYLAFYVGALANLEEIRGIFTEAQLMSPAVLMTLLVTTAVVLIPVRLFLFAAVAFDFPQFPEKFRRLFPVLLPLDLLWALSPFLLVHHINIGLALGMTAALVYLPFAQRSLVLMYEHGRMNSRG
jgi:DNA-binding winged helix-turn-helix (wHTH) protein